jgi:hypothetical protein
MGGTLLAELLLALDEEPGTDETGTDERDELVRLDERTLEDAALEAAPTTPKGAGCALQVEAATQLLPFS